MSTLSYVPHDRDEQHDQQAGRINSGMPRCGSKDQLQPERRPLLRNNAMLTSPVGSNNFSPNNGVDMNVKEDFTGDIKLSKRRYIVLFLLCCVTFSNGCMWISLTSIASITERYYNQTYAALNWLSMSFLLAFPLFFVPTSYVLTRYGVKVTLVIAVCLNGIGAALRFAGAGRDGFVYVAVGQCMAAVASSFTLQVPPFVSAVWFPENEKATATSMGVLANMMGVAVGFFMSSSMVHANHNRSQVEDEIHNLLLAQAVFCAILVPAVVILVKNKPAYPPSVSQALFLEAKAFDVVSNREEFRSYVHQLFTNVNYHLLAQAYGLMFGLLAAFSSLLNELMSSFFPNREETIGLLGAVQLLFGLVGLVITGILVDRYRHYKFFAIFLLFASLLSMIAYTYVLISSYSMTLVFAAGCLLGLFGLPYYGCGLEQIAEITYPVPESLSSAYAIALGNLYGFIITLICGAVISAGYYWETCTVFATLYLVGFILVCVAKTPMRRGNADHGMVGDNTPAESY